MKLKMKALSLAVAAIAAGSAAHAADVAMFPYVVNSATVTTIVTIVDRGTAATQRYDASGVVGTAATNRRLHWRLNYKAGANAENNLAACQEVNYYLPSSPNDIQSVDIGGKFGSTSKGVLFSDPSSNNNWNAGTSATINYMLGKAAGATQRGTLFVHNADNTVGNTIYGEAMVLEFSTGAAWGYQAATTDNGGANNASAFDFSAAGGFVTNNLAASTTAPSGLLTFMPPAETTTRLFVTPMPVGALLAANGANAAGWSDQQVRVSMVTSSGVAYDRDENLVSGSATQDIRCVGAVNATDLVTSGALATLANGGWGNLTLESVAAVPAGAYTATDTAYITKLEYNTGGKINGETLSGTFNNGFIMR